MKKGTILVLVAALGLLGYIKFGRSSDKLDVERPIVVGGYLDMALQAEWRKRKDNPLLFLNEKEADRKKTFKAPPYDAIEVTRAGVTVTFEKRGEDDWHMTAPVNSEVENFRIKNMLEIFATDTHLSPSRTLTEAAALDFGLGPKRAIKVVLKEGGVAKVSLLIGDKVKVDGGEHGASAVYDTFVTTADRPEMLYRAKQKDLRGAFDREVGELRSKKVFSFDKTDIVGVKIEDPASSEAKAITLKATWPEPEKKDDDTDAGAKKEPTKAKAAQGSFVLETPAVPGFVVANLNTFFSQLAGMRASAFIMGKDVTPETGLGDLATAARVTVTLKDGTTHVIVFGAVKEKDKSYYAQIQGKSEYMEVSKYTRENLLKRLTQLRDKAVLGQGLTDEDITRVSIKNEHVGDGAMVFERQAAGWRMVTPKAMVPFGKEMTALLSGIRSLRATEFYAEPPAEADSGLATPSVVVDVTIKGVPRTLLMGATRDSNVVGHLKGTDLYFKLSTWTVNKFKKKPDEYRDRVVLKFESAKQVAKLRLVHRAAPGRTEPGGDETVALNRVPGQDGAWEMTAPKSLTAATGLKDAAVEGIAGALRGLEVKAFSDKAAAAVGLVPPAFTVSATLQDGRVLELHVSDTTEDNANYVSVVAPGMDPAAVYLLSKYKVQNLRKRVADLTKQAP